ncbi:MAG: NAD(P)H-hydrate dehydratase [Thermaurantimonas sp.]
MKILSAEQIREADQYTILQEPISSENLMERAAHAWAQKYLESDYYEYQKPVAVICGPGNNGGDGLVIARILANFHKVSVYLLCAERYSEDNLLNQKRGRDQGLVINMVEKPEDIIIQADAVIIDALFGTGLSRPLNGLASEVVRYLKCYPNPKIAVDIPSGMFADNNDANDPESILPVDCTITFQFPKLAFLMMPTGPLAGELRIADIGLHPHFIGQLDTPHHLMQKQDVIKLYKPRNPWIHKGQAGKGLLVGGIGRTSGAAILSAEAALRSGIGLLYTACGARALTAIASARPEVIGIDLNREDISEVISAVEPDAMAIGPGLGTTEEAAALLDLILEYDLPVVLDADALNLISIHRWHSRLSANHILTPHPGEASGLFGSKKPMEQHEYIRDFVKKSGCIIVYKGRFTRIYTSDGNVFFNSTGNAGMATAGSGDVLTGVLLALLATGYSQPDAARLGVYIHGLAGDLAFEDQTSPEGVIAGDIISFLGKAFGKVLK